MGSQEKSISQQVDGFPLGLSNVWLFLGLVALIDRLEILNLILTHVIEGKRVIGTCSAA